MNREEHLQRIVERCEGLISFHTKLNDEYRRAIAGWKSTISACKGWKLTGAVWIHPMMPGMSIDELPEYVQDIISAWPEELL